MNNIPNIPMGTPGDDGKTKSIISLVCGIASIVVGFLSGFIPFAFIIILATAVVGLVMGISGRSASIKATGKASGIATAGFVLGIVGLCLSPIFTICSICSTCAWCAAQKLQSELNDLSGLLGDLSNYY
ncbi:MAG: hypothetical protein IKV54_03130 [Clostridia bacterium]|nr:hypothetical protein [Clostridia bacterium]